MSTDALYRRCKRLIRDIRNALPKATSALPANLVKACLEISALLSPYSPYGPAIGRCVAQLASKSRENRPYLPILLAHWEEDVQVYLHDALTPQALCQRGQTQVQSLRRLRPLMPMLLSRPYDYEVTIAVTAYNKLEYTKLAVESILQHTDLASLGAELLLIDNGSNDGTADYFATIPQAKVLCLPEPLGYPATSLGALAARGRYYVHFANDIIATPRYLEGLLRCIRADSRTGMAVPLCNAMSSGQSIAVSYPDPRQDPNGLVSFAAAFNRSDPLQWEERPRLLPCMSIMPTVLARACPNDPWFRFGEFADDDVSTRLRRAGFRQMLARDTFVHHFGSVTASTVQSQAQTLPQSRLLYRQKWGVDAWSSMDWDTEIAQRTAACLEGPQSRVLWLDPRFGTQPLYCRTLCRQKGVQSIHCAAETKRAYLPDAEGLFAQAYGGPWQDTLPRFAPGFDAIVCCRDLSCYPEEDRQALLSQAARLLAPGGRLYCMAKNAAAYETLYNLSCQAFATPYGEEDLPYHPVYPSTLSSHAAAYGLSVSFACAPLALPSVPGHEAQPTPCPRFFCEFRRENHV